ncbi:MAG TPA: hypothetical protein PKX31_12125, partial [Chitinophagaceae bacterium]|nr:hypothetical protein [Chitinophagaceae bacterium]
SFLKPISDCMNQPFYNDQAHIAESFHLVDDFTSQTARLAIFKINSYKLSMIKSSFRETREELRCNLNNSLMNFTAPGIILADLGFFESEFEN